MMAVADSRSASREIRDSELTLVRHLAQGGMAEVSLCRWKRDGETRLVAKKSLLKGDFTKFKAHLTQEISILVSVDHPNIVRTYGYVHSRSDFGLIMEYYKFGSYQNFFVDMNCLTNSQRDSENNKRLYSLKLRVLKELIAALKFLHTRRPRMILHLDLKSDNLLLDDNLHVKVSDFGLSEMKTVSRLSRQSSTRSGTVPKGTLFYMAPEHLSDPCQKYTAKTDVYAFGILAWQILTDAPPYEGCCNDNMVMICLHVQTGNLRPDLSLVPENYSEDFVDQIIKKPWDQFLENRPDFAELAENIDDIIFGIVDFEEKSDMAAEFAKQLYERYQSIFGEVSIAMREPEQIAESDMIGIGLQNPYGSSLHAENPEPDQSQDGANGKSDPTPEELNEQLDEGMERLQAKFGRFATHARTTVDVFKYLMSDKINIFEPGAQSDSAQGQSSGGVGRGEVSRQLSFPEGSRETAGEAESPIPGFPQPLYENLNEGGKNFVNWVTDMKNDLFGTMMASENKAKNVAGLMKELWKYQPQADPRNTRQRGPPLHHRNDRNGRQPPPYSYGNMDYRPVYESETVPKYVFTDVTESALQISDDTESDIEVLGKSSKDTWFIDEQD